MGLPTNRNSKAGNVVDRFLERGWSWSCLCVRVCLLCPLPSSFLFFSDRSFSSSVVQGRFILCDGCVCLGLAVEDDRTLSNYRTSDNIGHYSQSFGSRSEVSLSEGSIRPRPQGPSTFFLRICVKNCAKMHLFPSFKVVNLARIVDYSLKYRDFLSPNPLHEKTNT